MKIRIIVFLFPFLLLNLNFLTAMGGKTERVPVGIKKPVITDMEYFKYAKYSGGQFKRYEFSVYHLSNDGKILIEYYGPSNDIIAGKSYSNAFILPSNPDNFPSIYTYDMQSGSLLHVIENWYADTNVRTGTVYTEIIFDYDHLKANCIVKSWNGHEIKTQSSHYPLKKGFCYFYNQTIYTQIRFIDPAKPGTLYAVSPQLIKEPEEITFKILNKVNINLPLGKFSTLELGMTAADPFISMLMITFSKQWRIFIDNSLETFVIKNKEPDGSWKELAETGIWTNK